MVLDPNTVIGLPGYIAGFGSTGLLTVSKCEGSTTYAQAQPLCAHELRCLAEGDWSSANVCAVIEPGPPAEG